MPSFSGRASIRWWCADEVRAFSGDCFKNGAGCDLDQLRGIDEHDAARGFFGEGEVALADGVEKRLRFAFDAVEFVSGGAHAAAGGRAVHIENECEIRQGGSHGKAVDLGGVCRIDAASHALVDGGRVHEAVTDHNAPGGEGWLDDFAHELGAARGEKEEFGLRGECLALRRVLEKMTDGLSRRGAAWLAEKEWIDARGAQVVGKEADLGGFPAALGAFECDEKTCVRHEAKGFDLP